MHTTAQALKWSPPRLPHTPAMPRRNIKAHDRKIRKAKAKLNTELAKRLVALKPGYKVDHLVKER